MAKIMRLIALFFHNKYIQKIIVVLTILLFITSLCLAGRTYYLHKTLVPAWEQKLQRKLNSQMARINEFLDDNNKKANALALDPIILDYQEKVVNKENILPTERQNFSNYIAKRQKYIGFKSFSMIDKNSDIIFSTSPLLRDIQLNNDLYINTPLYKSYFVSSMTMTRDFSDFYYSTLIKAPAFYITMPLIRNNKMLGEMAYQIDEDKITSITRDYLDLGTTGEIVLAVQSGDYAVFITPTRNDPSILFTKKELFGKSNLQILQEAARGQTGNGVGTDYRGIKTVASWSFIPRVDWAIVVKINLSEVLEPIVSNNKFLIPFIVLTLIFAALIMIIHRDKVGQKLSIIRRLYEYIPAPVRHLEIFLILIFLILSILAVYQYKHNVSAALKKSQDLAIEEVKDGITKIDIYLEQVRRLANFIAQDLRTERLISKDIIKRLRREIVETDGLVTITIAYAPYQYSDKVKLYAPSITQKNDGTLVERQIGESYDYTNKEEGVDTLWYTQAMTSQKPQWLNPSIDPLSEDRVIIYSLPFYFQGDEQVPAGVIAISYKLPIFVEVAQNIGIGETGYTFIISQDGTFLYYPILEKVIEKETLLEFAQEEGNNSLELIAHEIKDGKPILKELSSRSTQDSSWIYTHPISLTGWTIATVFFSNEIGLASSVIKDYIFDIIICFCITLLLILSMLCHLYSHNSLFSFLNFSNFILIITLLCLWYIIQTTGSSESKSNVLITNQSSIDKFIHRQAQEANRKNEPPPIAIPCGVELYSLQQPSTKDVSFSGYIWHRYHKTMHKDIRRIIRIPQATSFSVINESTASEGDWDVVGLNVSATIYHELDYTKYPFEKHQIIIPLEHADIGKNIMLVPDLRAYTSINPNDRPGLDRTFSATNFHTSETFFNYTPHEQESDLGVPKYRKLGEQYRLAFNAVIESDLLVPFIYFFLPLLVMLITIFGVLVLEQRGASPYAMIGSYTGLLFALVILHRSLHEAVPSSHTLYIEYAFFYTYIILILLVIHSILVQRFAKRQFYEGNLVPLFKVIFWPLQLVAWIITTLVIFY